MNIKGNFFLITGANRGIGRAVALCAASRGAHLILVIRNSDQQLEKNLLDAGASSVQTIVADLASRSGVEQLLEKLSQQRVDILFNNAGVLTGGLIEEQSDDEIYQVFQVNVLSLIQLTKAIVPKMIQQKKGLIVNHSSVSALMHFPAATTYSATKAAVLAFNNCLQNELQGTHVNTLALITPGVKTRMFDEIDIKYSKNLETPKDSMPAEVYAERVCDAIESGQKYLWPTGVSAIGLFLVKYFPRVFYYVVSKKFRR